MSSVCLSVTLMDQDHIVWKSWKLIARTLSVTFALRSPKAIHLLPGEHGEMLGRLEVGWENVVCWSTKSGNISETRTDRGKVTMGAYRNSPTLFPTASSPAPYGLLFPKMGFAPNPKFQSLLYYERVKLRTSNLARTFGWVHPNKSP